MLQDDPHAASQEKFSDQRLDQWLVEQARHGSQMAADVLFHIQEETMPLLISVQATQMEGPARLAIDIPSASPPGKQAEQRPAARSSGSQSSPVFGGLASLLIALITGLLIVAFSQFAIFFWHLSPTQALPAALIVTAIILWLILERLQFSSLLQPGFGLAGSFSPLPEQQSAFHQPAHAKHARSSKEQPASNLFQRAYLSSDQLPFLKRQTCIHPLTLHRRRHFPIPHIAVLLLVAIGVSLYTVIRLNPLPNSNSASPSGPLYGLSIDGNHVFDLDRPDMALKLQAANAITNNDSSLAEQLLHQALLIDSSDAEALIYLADLNVLASHRPYVTVVVTTTMDAGHTGGGRDMLQGAYLVQQDINEHALLANGVQLRLLIASVGFDNTSSREVAQQIVQQAQRDHTIVGVMGFPTSANTLDALPILAQAHIPIVSSAASSDELTDKSPYFFRVIPSDAQQGAVAARYAKQVLHAHHIAVFEDPQDPYSHSLAEAFIQNFTDATHTVTTLNYTREQPQTLPHSMQQIQNLHADLLYFSGYVNDAAALLKNLPPCQSRTGSCLQVMGGDAFYVQGDYSLAAYNSYSRLIFTAFASPDTWKVQGLPEPAFFHAYAATFDPHQLYQPGTYGHNLPDADAILAYDAMQALERAIALAQTRTHSAADITPAIIQQSLTCITGSLAIQGVSGTISFHNGEVSAKPVLVLQSEPDGQTRIDSIAYP
jgi:ABC-type branched-subunit amino acid transport system substrate-binding protein